MFWFGRHPADFAFNTPVSQSIDGGIPADRIDTLSIEDHDAKLDISSLINLTYLRLNYATNKQLEQIRNNHFESLRALTIVTCSMDHRLETILFGPTPLKYLQRCRIPSLILSQVNRPCSTLRSLRLNFCTMATCSRLLTFLPNLRRLETAIQHTTEDLLEKQR